MKVIHIFNQANVAATFVEALNRLPDVEAECHTTKLMHKPGFGATVHDIGRDWMVMIHNLLPTLYEADIIHIHTSFLTVAFLRLQGLKLINTPIILHFHGSEIRDRYHEQLINGIECANRIMYSTPDLLSSIEKFDLALPPIHVPNPVSRNVFKPIKPYCDERKEAVLYFRTETEPLKLSRRMVELVEKKTGYPVEVIDRANNWIPHDEMAQLLNKYNYFLNDLAGDDALSYTSHQMLATGGKVITTSADMISRNEIRIIDILPEEYDADKSVMILYNEYKRLIEESNDG